MTKTFLHLYWPWQVPAYHQWIILTGACLVSHEVVDVVSNAISGRISIDHHIVHDTFFSWRRPSRVFCECCMQCLLTEEHVSTFQPRHIPPPLVCPLERYVCTSPRRYRVLPRNLSSLSPAEIPALLLRGHSSPLNASVALRRTPVSYNTVHSVSATCSRTSVSHFRYIKCRIFSLHSVYATTLH